MTLLFPQKDSLDPLPANTPSQSRPVLGEKDALGIRPFGRPQGVAPVTAVTPKAYTALASSGDIFFRTERER